MYLEIKEDLDSPNLMGPPCSSEHFKLRWRSVWVGVGGWEGEGCSSIPYWSCIWCLKRRRGQLRMPCSCWRHLCWSVNPSLTRRLPFPLMDSWCKIADCLRDRLANLYWVSNKDKLTKQRPRQRQRQIWQIGQIGKLILSYWQKILRSEELSENDDI